LGLSQLPDDIVVYRVEGPLFYAAVETFERVLTDVGKMPNVLVIRLAGVPFIDATGLRALEDLVDFQRAKGGAVLLTEANERVRRKLLRMGLSGKLGGGDPSEALDQALGTLIKNRGARA